MTHLLHFVYKSTQIAKDTWTVGLSGSACDLLVSHDDRVGLRMFTKDGEKVTCAKCILHMLAEVP